MFKLDATLHRDSFLIGDLKLCQLLLANHKFYPWLILVPKREDSSEIFDLSLADQNQLMIEINLVASFSKDFFKADKMNIAAFGNVVNQLHIHIIARFKSDRVWPAPIWLDKEKMEYETKEAEGIIEEFKLQFKNKFQILD